MKARSAVRTHIGVRRSGARDAPRLVLSYERCAEPLLREGPVPAVSAPVPRVISAWQSSGVALAAAHLQSPVSIMHAWTTSFPW